MVSLQEMKSLFKMLTANEKLSHNHGPNISELYDIIEKFGFTISKAMIDIYIKNIVYVLPHELLSD